MSEPALPPPADAFGNYRALVARVDAHWDKTAAAVPLACARGCTACCYVDLSVSRVEADALLAAGPFELPQRARRGERDAHPLFEQLAGPQPCVLLNERGDCAVYAARPLICRSHGIPVQAEGKVDACPLNAEAYSAPPLNLQLLNTLLTAINAKYCQDTGQAPERVRLRDLKEQLRAQVRSTQEPQR
ncbi:MAG: YkgJ family cysteine cluster protein [Myxococcota bacterium]